MRSAAILLLLLAGAALCNFWVEKTRAANGLAFSRSAKNTGWNAENAHAVAASAFWETRRALAIISWAEAQTYFHGGFDLAAFISNKAAEEKAQTDLAKGDDDEDDKDLRIHSRAEQIKIHSLENHPFTRESLMRPYVYKHFHGEKGPKQMMPFYWLTTQLDPHFVRAYSNGAFWLAFHFNRSKEAMEYLERGRKYNPAAYSIYGMMGHIRFSILKQYDAAAGDLEKAVILNPCSTFDEADDMIMTLRYLGRTYLELGKYDSAISTAYRGKRLDPGAVGFNAIISEATIALEYEQPAGNR